MKNQRPMLCNDQRTVRHAAGLLPIPMVNPSESEKLSVAVLLSGREKFGACYGGALARWTYEVYRHLTDKVAVTVFGFPSSDDDRYPLPHEASRVWRLCVLMGHVPLARRYEDRVWLRALRGRLRNFAVVHIHNRPQWAAMLRQFGYRGAIVLHLQNDHLGHWSGPMLDALAPQVQAVAVCSEYLRGTFAPKSSLLASKAHVIFNGVNTDLFFLQEGMREPKTIFFVGRLDPQKGVLPLVHAYARVLKDHPDARLVIGGTTGFGVHDETDYVREVREVAQSIVARQHGNIQFTGYVHHDRDLPRWFQRATIFASPSLFQEPFGLVNVEAMACGTVVVGSARGGIPEVLGETGQLVDPENIGEFAEAISSLLADPKHRSELAATSLERVRKLFAWPVIAERWAELLTKVAPKSRANCLAASSKIRHAKDSTA